MLIIYNANLIDRDTTGKGFVVCNEEKIISVEFNDGSRPSSYNNGNSFADDAIIYDANGLTLMPAFIDMHAHFRYPGQPQKEDLDSGLAAARNGGFGTLVLMPNTNPVISSYESAMAVITEARAKKMSNIFQTTSITRGFEGKDTSHLDSINSKDIPVITEDGHDVLSADIMLDGMKKAAEKGVIVSCHCEDPSLAVRAREYRQRALALMKEYKIPAWGVIPSDIQVPQNVYDEIAQNLSTANELLQVAEDTCTYRNLELAHIAGCHVHICHVSTKGSIDAVRDAKAKGYDCTCEVTPHHIALTGDKIPEILALVNPPLRHSIDRRAVIDALRDGTADTIATDHAPHTADDKASGAPGFTGSETAFAVCNTVLVKEEGFSLNKLSSLMSSRSAEILGLKKGLLQSGYDADLVLVDPDEKWTVHAADFSSKGKASPFENKKLIGRVKKLFVGGREIV
ncbi:dihydroorotase [Treponema sp.]|uniref:dihydroorotase n=1 Tax=Treponema sp. TaxID=166 RepID=UPI00298E3B6A|nr:dihydroorotase [Treponema sp.]MCR5613876.1 dihydroorotase [Treponema sp.]